LRDYVLYAADEGAIEIHWSQHILDEMSRSIASTSSSDEPVGRLRPTPLAGTPIGLSEGVRP
jgi:hypothetical protein